MSAMQTYTDTHMFADPIAPGLRFGSAFVKMRIPYVKVLSDNPWQTWIATPYGVSIK